MNKLKVLYDVVTVMKNKEVLNGIITAQVHKDEAQMLSFQNEFEKSLLTGRTKAKIDTEFTAPHGDDCRHRDFFRNLHQCHDARCCGLRGKLNKLAFAFSLLNALQVNEQDGKTLVLSLKFADLSEEIKTLLGEKLRRAHVGHHEQAGVKNCCAVEDVDGSVSIFVNKNSEVEKIALNLSGISKDEQSATHKLSARAELSLVW